jgi:hypothetical protein
MFRRIFTDPPPGFVVLTLAKGGVCVIPERVYVAGLRLGTTLRRREASERRCLHKHHERRGGLRRSCRVCASAQRQREAQALSGARPGRIATFIATGAELGKRTGVQRRLCGTWKSGATGHDQSHASQPDSNGQVDVDRDAKVFHVQYLRSDVV